VLASEDIPENDPWWFRQPISGNAVNSELDKQTQRAEFRQVRDSYVNNLTDQDRALSFSRIPSPLVKILTPGKIVAGYVAKGSEVDPSAILTQGHALGCDIALPHVTSKSAPMRFLRWSLEEELVPGPFGLQQPAETAPECKPDIVLVPLLAYDDRLIRLGQGAGHYDRALSLLEHSIAIGLAWSVQFTSELASDIWDAPLDAVLTEKSWITL
jgi:5-formyltetrahydrofolate cyclo-ligase